MASKEWFRITGAAKEYPNVESAVADAQALAADWDGPVEVVRYTSSVVRCFQRKIVVEEQPTPLAVPA